MSENCLDITLPFVEGVQQLGIPIQIYGGVGSAAVKAASTTYLQHTKEMPTAERLYIDRLRENGSTKDLDVQVLTLDPSVVKTVEGVAAETVGNQLDVNVFGLHTYEELEHMIKKPLSFRAAKAALTDRYVVSELTGRDEDEYYKAVIPFGVVVPQSALETWHVVWGSDTAIPVPHPAMMILNNLTRSIAGLRAKYNNITVEMTDNLMARDPGLVEWMMDGPGRSHLELAGVLRSLGWLGMLSKAPHIRISDTKNICIVPPNPEELTTQPSYLMAGKPWLAQMVAQSLATIKATGLVGPVERHLQDQWEQLNLERFFKKIVRNN